MSPQTGYPTLFFSFICLVFTLRPLLVLLKYINIDIFSYRTMKSFYICCRSISLELFMVHRLGIKHEIQISIFVYSSETTNEMNKKV